MNEALEAIKFQKQKLADQIENKKWDPKSEADFQRVIYIVVGGMLIPKKTIASRWKASEQGVDRWRDGITCPIESARISIFEWIVAELKKG